MADLFRLNIDLRLVADRIAEGEGRPVTIADAEVALFEAGFIRHGWGWTCEAVSLDWLNEDEYSDLRPVDGG